MGHSAMKCIVVNSREETAAVARRLAQAVEPGAFICLTGDLGAGKTTFTQAFAKGLGIDEPVTSPTFTLVQEYQGRIPLYHFDVYRIGHPEEMEDLGYRDYFYGQGVCVVEWAALIRELVPEAHLWIRIKVLGETVREICLEPSGPAYEDLIKELFER